MTSTRRRVDSIVGKIIVLSQRQVCGYHGDAPYVVISIRSPGRSIPKLRFDPLRRARINFALHDTIPEWEALSSEPVAVMTRQNAQRIAQFVAQHWEFCDIVVHCKLGVSRSAGVAAGILDAYLLDASPYKHEPYEPNPHFRRMVREQLELLLLSRHSLTD
jgi:predicted protein tyrosine phosphatase